MHWSDIDFSPKMYDCLIGISVTIVSLNSLIAEKLLLDYILSE